MAKGIIWAIPIAPIAIPYDRHHPNGEPHHITLQYGINRQDWESWLDTIFTAEIYEESWDEYIQAFRVRLPDGIPCINRHPHITVSWAEGRSPVDANRMIDEMHFSRPFAVPIVVPCRIEFHEWANPPP
jgi:hypothetical protein